MIAEVSRVLRPGGVLAAIAPALRPLGPRDLRVLSRINARLRTKPQFPGPVEMVGCPRRSCHGLRRVEDARERYRFTVAYRSDAELMLSARYLPQTRSSRVEAAIELLEDRVTRAGRSTWRSRCAGSSRSSDPGRAVGGNTALGQAAVC